MKNTQKLLSLLLGAVLAFSVFAAVPVTAGAAEISVESSGESIVSGDYEYIVLDDGTAEITGYTGTDTELVIPSELDGYIVTSIGYGAFYGCESLTSITIPDSVMSTCN